MHTWFCVTQHLLTYPVGDAGSAENTPFVLHAPGALRTLPVRSRIDRERQIGIGIRLPLIHREWPGVVRN
jgi:hypothetical protein